MESQLTEEQTRELERQLSCPSGDGGIEVGKAMNETNIGMTRATIEQLALDNNHQVLELGHGICGHLDEIMNKAEGIIYHGLEISETMHEQAKTINSKYTNATCAVFHLYEGDRIPFLSNTFDRVLSVNTIYFWSSPQQFVQEIERVLKPGGLCVLTFATKDFMKELSFVGERFTVYNHEDFVKLVNTSTLTVQAIQDRVEQVISKAGEHVERSFTVAELTKKL